MESNQPIPPGPNRQAPTGASRQAPAYLPAGSPPNHAVIAGVITATCLLGGIGAWMVLSKDKTQTSRPGTMLTVPMDHPTGAADQNTSTPAGMDSGQQAGAEAAPTVLLKDLIRGVLGRDLDQIAALVPMDPEDKSILGQALESRQLIIDPQRPVHDLGEISDGVHRWAVNVLRPSDKTKGQLLVDLVPDGSGGWTAQHLTLPDFLASAPANREVIELAADFVDHLIAQDFDALAKITKKDAVPNEKLAALALMFEEAAFQPLEDRAYRPTNVTDDRAWVIAKVESIPYNLKSEIGLELLKEEGQWIIERVNVSTLMHAFLDLSQAQDALKAPLVENPQGGESVVLYFGYDSDQLTPRSLKQLSLISSILKQSGNHEIRIAGHTDSLGDDPYNDALSQRRARRVASTLRSLGVLQRQIKLESFGERVPLSPNIRPDGSDNPEGRERNRRAEIYLDF